MNSPALTTPDTADIFSDIIEPKKLSFDEAKPKRKSFFNKLNIFSTGKKNQERKEGFPLLEYKPSKPPATAPAFTQSQTSEVQTTPVPTGHQKTQELKNLVNQLHAAHPKTKIHVGTFRSAIAKRLKELGVEASHTTTYVEKMRKFYDEIFAASNGGEPEGGVL